MTEKIEPRKVRTAAHDASQASFHGKEHDSSHAIQERGPCARKSIAVVVESFKGAFPAIFAACLSSLHGEDGEAQLPRSCLWNVH